MDRKIETRLGGQRQTDGLIIRRQMDRQIDMWAVERIHNGQVERYTNKYMNRKIDINVDREMERKMITQMKKDRHRDGQIDGDIDGNTDEHTYIQLEGKYCLLKEKRKQS